MEKIVFLTRATGFVGGNLAVRLLNDPTVSKIFFLVRANSQIEGKERLVNHLLEIEREQTLSLLSETIGVIRGDLTQPRLGLSVIEYETIAAHVTHIIHSAANVSFTQTPDEALKNNYHGTENMLHFAMRSKEHGTLKRFCYVGTAFVSGNRSGTIYEDELAKPTACSNSHEHSKFESELLVRSYSEKLPVPIFKPSLIVGDSKKGTTTAFKVIYYPLKLIYKGHLHFGPGSPGNYIDIVPVDYVADAIVYLTFRSDLPSGKAYHLTGAPKAATTVGELVQLSLAYFKESDTNRTLPGVMFIPQIVYTAVKQLSAGILKSLTEKVDVYLPYLNIQRVFDDTNAQNALYGSGIAVPKCKEYYRAILRYCIDTNWEKRVRVAV